MTINPIAYFRSPMKSKFGIPRQSNVVKDLWGEIVFVPEYRSADAVRGLEDFDFLWLIWEFSANKHVAKGTTVRPPRLGGNKHLGVFATRSPYRPNPIGLSSVRIESIDYEASDGPVIKVLGTDLMDGTPIYDIKPYVPYADAHPEAKGGFTSTTEWKTLEVIIPDEIAENYTVRELKCLREILSQDPRPQYHNDPERVYGFCFSGKEIHFRVHDGVVEVEAPSQPSQAPPQPSPIGRESF